MKKNIDLFKRILAVLEKGLLNKFAAEDWHERRLERLKGPEGEEPGSGVAEEVEEVGEEGEGEGDEGKHPHGGVAETTTKPKEKAEDEPAGPAPEESLSLDVGEKSKYMPAETEQLEEMWNRLPAYAWHPDERRKFTVTDQGLEEGGTVDPVYEYRNAKDWVETWTPEHDAQLQRLVPKAQGELAIAKSSGDEGAIAEAERNLEMAQRDFDKMSAQNERNQKIYKEVEEAQKIAHGEEDIDALLDEKDAAPTQEEREVIQYKINKAMNAARIYQLLSPQEELSGDVLSPANIGHEKRALEKMDADIMDLAKKRGTVRGEEFRAIEQEMNALHAEREKLVKKIRRDDAKAQALEAYEKERGLMREHPMSRADINTLMATPPEEALAGWTPKQIYDLIPFLQASQKSPGMKGKKYYADRAMLKRYIDYITRTYAEQFRDMQGELEGTPTVSTEEGEAPAEKPQHEGTV